MQTTFNNDILFDDSAVIANLLGANYLNDSKQALTIGDCNNYTDGQDSDEIEALRSV